MSNRHYNKRTLNNAKILRSAPTQAEKILWFNLRNSKLKGIKFRRQVPVGDYIIDFLCMSKKLAIELDGSQHIDNIEYCSIRTSFLQSQGYSVIRIFNDEIFKNINNVLEYIYQKYLEL